VTLSPALQQGYYAINIVPNSSKYVFAAALQMTAGYIVLPFLLDAASLEQYGSLFLLLTVVGTVSLLVARGSTNIISGYFRNWRAIGSARPNVSMLCYFVLRDWCLLVLVTLFIRCFFPGDIITTILSVIILAGAQSISGVVDTYLRFDRRANLFLFLTLCSSVIRVLACIFYLKHYEFVLSEYLVVSAASYIPALSFATWVITRYGDSKTVQSRRFLVYRRYGNANLRSNLVGQVVSVLDRPIMLAVGGEETAGVYALAQKFSGSLGSLRVVLKNIWFPLAIEKYRNHGALRLNRLAIWTIFLLTVTLWVAAPVFVYFTTEIDYFELFLQFLIPLTFTNVIWVFYYFHLSSLIARKKNSKLVKIQIYSGLIYLIALGLLSNFDFSLVPLAFYFQLGALLYFTRLFYGNVLDESSFNARLVVGMCCFACFGWLSVMVGAEKFW